MAQPTDVVKVNNDDQPPVANQSVEYDISEINMQVAMLLQFLKHTARRTLQQCRAHCSALRALP